MSLIANLAARDETLETFKDNFGAYSTIRWSATGEILSWVQHFTNEEATHYHRNATAIYTRKGRAS